MTSFLRPPGPENALYLRRGGEGRRNGEEKGEEKREERRREMERRKEERRRGEKKGEGKEEDKREYSFICICVIPPKEWDSLYPQNLTQYLALGKCLLIKVIVSVVNEKDISSL